MSLQIVVADDHAIARLGVRHILRAEPGMAVAAEASDAHAAVEAACQPGIDLLLLECAMSDLDWRDVLRQVRHRAPQVAVLMLSRWPESEIGLAALKAGAAGFLSKSCEPDKVVEAIRDVASGRKVVSAALTQQLACNLGRQQDRDARHHGLSEREQQTMLMIASGQSVSEIGAELGLSIKTVSMYRSRLLAKTGLRNNAEIIHYAVRNALVTPLDAAATGHGAALN